ITKPSLKTHVFFNVVKSVFQKSKDLSNSTTRSGKARKLMTQMVNALGVKMELGAPLICSYLLGFPDRYMNRKFVTFYWHAFVAEARNAWKEGEEKLDEVKVHIKRHMRDIVSILPVEDYIRRLVELSHFSLYEWMCRCERSPNSKLPKSCTEYMLESDVDNFTDTLVDWGDSCTEQSSDKSHEVDVTHDGGSHGDAIGDAPANENKQWMDALGLLPDSQRTLVKTHGTQFTFPNDHPMANTHHVTCHSEKDRHVTNFVGGMLLCSDAGDREFYCSTMMVFFVPW
ncbi:hypothetical protein ARMGADRAFT_950402, partial [Armillaria gallica]